MRRRPRKVRTLLVAVALVAGLLPGEAHAGRSFGLSGTDCFETVMTVPVPAASVGLPADFKPVLTGGGLAVLGVGMMRCARMAVDGQAQRDATLSDVGVMIDSPDGSGGAHWYQLWQHGDLRHLHNRMRQLGVPGQPADARLAWTDLASAGRVLAGRIGVGSDSYAMDATVSAPAGEVPGSPAWWHEGPYGRVRLRYEVTGGAGTGAGVLRAEPGSTLAGLIGAPSVAAPAVALGFHTVRATAEVVSPPD